MRSQTFTLKIPATKRVKTEDGHGWKTIPDGYRVGTIRVEIDEEYICQSLGEKAMRNRTKKAVLGSGTIVVTARDIRRVEE